VKDTINGHVPWKQSCKWHEWRRRKALPHY